MGEARKEGLRPYPSEECMRTNGEVLFDIVWTLFKAGKVATYDNVIQAYKEECPRCTIKEETLKRVVRELALRAKLEKDYLFDGTAVFYPSFGEKDKDR